MDEMLSNAEPSMQLTEPVNINDLLGDKGMTFEVNYEDFQEDRRCYEGHEVVDICNFDCLGVHDEDVYDESTPFESIAKTMEDLTPDGGIKKRILREGYGNVVPKKSFVYINYNAYLEYNEEPFDSTYLLKKPFSFNLSEGQTLPGLDIAVQSMKMNEKAQFLIAPDYAYGKMGCFDRIPPESTVLFEVELQNFADSGAALVHGKRPEELTDFKDVHKYCVALCEKGNDLVKNNQNYKLAIKQYNIAAAKLETCLVNDDNQQEQMDKLCLRLYTNLAICHQKQDEPKKCCINCNKIYHLCRDKALVVPTKIFYNNAKALIMLNDLKMAEKRLREAARRDRDNPDIVKCFLTINNLKEKEKEQEKRLAKILVGKKDKGINDGFKNYVIEVCEELSKSTSEQAVLPAKLSTEEVAFVKTKAKEFGMELLAVDDKDGERYTIIKSDK